MYTSLVTGISDEKWTNGTTWIHSTEASPLAGRVEPPSRSRGSLRLCAGVLGRYRMARIRNPQSYRDGRAAAMVPRYCDFSSRRPVAVCRASRSINYATISARLQRIQRGYWRTSSATPRTSGSIRSAAPISGRPSIRRPAPSAWPGHCPSIPRRGAPGVRNGLALTLRTVDRCTASNHDFPERRCTGFTQFAGPPIHHVLKLKESANPIGVHIVRNR